jgi:tryptophan synthase beta chain
MQKPDAQGYFGRFGGKYVPEVLVAALEELERAMDSAFADPSFWADYHALLRDYVGRPSPLFETERFVGSGEAATVALKREDLNHTGSHKINNTVGQGLLAKRMGKKRIIAETGAGQHGVATATIGAKLGIPVDVYMGARDVERQALNVYVMRLLGATVHPVTGGTQTLKDATNEAFREWAARIEDTFYVIGSVVGAHPYPYMVREFQKVIGEEARAQTLERYGRLPTDIVACVGGGSNSMGIFAGFADDPGVKLWGVEAAGHGIASGETAAAIGAGSVGILHGSRSYLLQTEDGQVCETHSISAGLDYPGVGPEHAFLKESGRAEYVAVTDDEALEAFHRLAETEGIVPALESAHALSFARKLALERGKAGLIVVSLSGRGDKDTFQVAALEGGADLMRSTLGAAGAAL